MITLNFCLLSTKVIVTKGMASKKIAGVIAFFGSLKLRRTSNIMSNSSQHDSELNNLALFGFIDSYKSFSPPQLN